MLCKSVQRTGKIKKIFRQETTTHRVIHYNRNRSCFRSRVQNIEHHQTIKIEKKINKRTNQITMHNKLQCK